MEFNQTKDKAKANKALASFYLVEPNEMRNFSKTIDEIAQYLLEHNAK